MHNNRPTTIREALQRASSLLSDAHITEPTFTAEYLLRSFLGFDRTRFVIELQSDIAEGDWERFTDWLARATAGEPIQYIVGKQDFYGETFAVAPGVLIPRPETEALIERVLEAAIPLADTYDGIRVIDLGTGSGIIPVILAKLRPEWEIWALDLSTTAIEQAKQNATRLGVADRIHFIHGDMLAIMDTIRQLPIAPSFHIVVSNPPYIPSKDLDTLQREVRDHEPRMALDGGADGLDFYRAICAQVRVLLTSPGIVAFEVGIEQDEIVAQLLREAGAIDTAIYPDFRGIGRVVVGTF